MRRKIKKMDCIEYLSVQAPLEKVNMLEDKQSKYIHEFVKRKEYSIVGKMRRNGFSQRDVDRQWNQIVNMIRKKQISGVVVANMAAISSSVADAYFKVGLVIEAGGIVVTVDEGRLDMHIKKLKDIPVHVILNPKDVSGFGLSKISDFMPEDAQTISKGCIRAKSGTVIEDSGVREEIDRALIRQFDLLPVARKMVMEELANGQQN